MAKQQAGQSIENLRLTQRIIDLADGDPIMGSLVIESPLAFAQTYRAAAETSLGMPGFREHAAEALATARPYATDFADAVMLKYVGIAYGAYLPDETALREFAEALSIAEQFGDPIVSPVLSTARGIT